MNKVYKTGFNKKTGKLVVLNEMKSVFRKGFNALVSVGFIVSSAYPTVASAEAANGFYVGSVFTGRDGQEILNLNYLDQAMHNNGPTVGSGSIGAGENAVSFGAGEYWKPLGNLDKPQYYII